MIEKLAILVVSLVVLFSIYMVFVILPVIMYTDAQCLRQGMPKAHVTIGLERYCSTLDGSVTVKVTKQKD